MPFTFAHPAAAVPLLRPLRALGVLSALVAGSLTPDLPYFLPLSWPRSTTHSLAGLFWFCMPAGVVLYVLFHRVLDRPICALMPESTQRRCARVRPVIPAAAWSAAVLVSLLVGAASHILWDSFTHGGSVAMDLLPALETRLFRVSGYNVYVFTLLQHGSSVAGVAILTWLARRWLRTAEPDPGMPAPVLRPRTRWLVAGALVGVAVLAGVAEAMSRFPADLTVRALQPFARRIIVASLGAVSIGTLAYALAWHWYHAPRSAGR